MYVIINHETDNGKELEATLIVDVDNYVFEVSDFVINGIEYPGDKNLHRIHAYITKNIRERKLLRTFREAEAESRAERWREDY